MIDVAAFGMSFARWEPAVNHDNQGTIKLTFVQKLSTDFMPTTIGDSSGQFAIFHHALDVQIFDGDVSIGLAEIGRQLVYDVFAHVGDVSVESLNSQFELVPSSRSLFLSG